MHLCGLGSLSSWCPINVLYDIELSIASAVYITSIVIHSKVAVSVIISMRTVSGIGSNAVVTLC